MFGREKKELTAAELLDELTEQEGRAAAEVRSIQTGIQEQTAAKTQAHAVLDKVAFDAACAALIDLNDRLPKAQIALAEIGPKVQAAREALRKERIEQARERARAIAVTISQTIEPALRAWQEYRRRREEFQAEFAGEPLPKLDEPLAPAFEPFGGVSQLRYRIELAWPGALPADDPDVQRCQSDQAHERRLAESARPGVPSVAGVWS